MSILFGEEAKYIAQVIRGGSIENLPESIYKNKDIKDRVVDGFTHLAENCHGGCIGDEYFPSSALDVGLNPLIVTRWLRDEGIFASLFFCESMPEGGEEKIASLKESVAKDFDSIDLKELSRADYWSKAEFFALLFGEAYSDTFFPYMFQQSPFNLDKNIATIEKFLIGASERGELVATSSATPTLLSQYDLYEDDDKRFEPTQLLAVLDAKGYPIPDGLLKSIEGGEFDEAGKLLGGLRENMLYLLESGGVFQDQPPQPQTKLEAIKDAAEVLDKNIWICRGDFWSITWNGRPEIIIKDSLGMQCIAHLLLKEKVEISATELGKIANFEPQEIKSAKSKRLSPGSVSSDKEASDWKTHGLEVQDSEFSEQQVMDGDYIKGMKERLKDLQDIMKEADISGNLEAKEDCEDEIHKINKQLSANTDRKGQSKKFADTLESARQRVRHNITNALGKIKKDDSELEKYLTVTIKCENKKFIYTPHLADPIYWKVITK